jgi:hypothetical protein
MKYYNWFLTSDWIAPQFNWRPTRSYIERQASHTPNSTISILAHAVSYDETLHGIIHDEVNASIQVKDREKRCNLGLEAYELMMSKRLMI